MSVTIRTRYSPIDSEGISFLPDDPRNEGRSVDSMTQQQFKDECDINLIVERARKSGFINVPSEQPIYGDFADVGDFIEAQNLIAQASQYFDGLPANIRARFSNSPAEFLRFINDEANVDEAVSLGLLQRTEHSETAGGLVDNEHVSAEVQDPSRSDSQSS